MTERLAATPVVRPSPGARPALQLVVLVAAAALALRAPSLVAVVAPFVLALGVDLVVRWPREVEVEVELAAGRVMEGDDVALCVTVRATGASRRCRVRVEPSRRLVAGWSGRVHELAVGDTLELTATAERWGLAGVAWIVVDWRSPLGLLGARVVVEPGDRPVRVHPPTVELRTLVAPRSTGAWSGTHPAGSTGRGVEFAEMRPFAAGDLPRDVSWRVSARRGSLWVAARHPERSTDVVLLLDAFAPASVDEVVPAAAALVDAYLSDRDRVGVLGLSGVLTWVVPGGGDRHRHRVLDLLMRTQAVESWAIRDLGIVPRAALPPGALVVALTHLNPEMARAVADLRARRRDVVVVDMTPPLRSVTAGDELDDLARRLVVLDREDARDRLRRLGATVVAADEGGLAQAIAAAVAVRRARRVAS